MNRSEELIGNIIGIQYAEYVRIGEIVSVDDHYITLNIKFFDNNEVRRFSMFEKRLILNISSEEIYKWMNYEI